jgi:triosephosphate isomerase
MEQAANCIIAYEPIWAIGTGRTATAVEANRTIAAMRGALNRIYPSLYGAVADHVTILYGGSMNAANCQELLAQRDIDGGLVGGASLNADDFAKIVQ